MEVRKNPIKNSLTLVAVAGIILCFQNCGRPFEAIQLVQTTESNSLAAVTIPQISLTNPIPALSNSRSLTVGIKVTTAQQVAVASVSCRLDAAAATDCSNLQLNLTNLMDGDHTLRVGATDTDGNLAQEKIYNFRIDATAPVVTISQAPAAVTGSASAMIAFSATDLLSSVTGFACSRDGAAFAACTSPVNLTGLTAGPHTFRIRATDSAQNTSVEVPASWTVDMSAPVLTLSAPPAAFSNSKSASFTFSGTSGGQALVRYECSLDGAAFATCTSPASLSNLAEGNHSFAVRGVNAVGTVSSPQSANWRVDTVAPSTPVLTADVTSPTMQKTASISFSSTDSGSMIASFSCSLNGGAFATCTSPRALTGLSESAHTFQVRAVDSAGNTSAVGSFNWTVSAPVILDGVALYAANCAACHGPLSNSTRYNRTAAQIQASIPAVPTMNFLSTLTTAQVNAIAQALVKSNGGLANPFVCNSETGIAVLHRLTKREYNVTVLDLFAGQVTAADIQAEVAAVQQEFTNAVPSIRVFDSTNPNSMSLPLLMAYNAVATKAADVVVASTAKMNAVGGTCMSAATVNDACVNTFLDTFGMRSFRRPLTAAEKTPLLALYRSGTSSADSMARVIQALLMSPQFLYKLETNGAAVNGRTDLFQLDAYEVASRLSYAVLGSMPDQALFDAARTGSLLTTTGLQAQVERLAGLAKARDGIRAFYSQWLRLDYIPDIQATASVANGLNLATFKDETRQEIYDLMDHLIWTQRSNYRGLMTTNVAFPKSANLSRVYGVPTSTQAVALADSNRAGILTRAGLLAVDAVGHSNPIRRGVNARLHMLCDTLGSPPSNVETLAGAFDPLSSTREQVTSKTSAAQCMACHSRINPMGFAFENFDGFGRYRLSEMVTYNGQTRTHSIDSTVSPNIVSSSDPNVMGASAMQVAMSESSTGQACMVKQWLQYNTGRDAGTDDGCALSTMYEALNKGSVLDMLKAYTGTSGFMLKKLGPLN